MTSIIWPVVGQNAASVSAHAAILKVDIARLKGCLEAGGDYVPGNVSQRLWSSVDALLDKVLQNTDLATPEESVEEPREGTTNTPDSPSNLSLESFKTANSRDWKPETSSKIVLRDRTVKSGKALYTTPLHKNTNAIRLVRIDAQSDPRVDICGLLSAVPFDTCPAYQALSYTWGDLGDRVPIRLNGYLIYVTRNLKKALRRLRDLDTGMPIWIDAICINQDDAEERTYQVQLMRQIYETAFEVIVHLGEADDENQEAQPHFPAHTANANSALSIDLFRWTGDERDMSRVDYILDYAQEYADTLPHSAKHTGVSSEILAMCFIRLLAGDVHLSENPLLRNRHVINECFRIIEEIMRKPWWNRIWTVQEVTLPSVVTVLYGQHSAPLYVFTDAAHSLQNHVSTCCHASLRVVESQRSCLDNFVTTLARVYEGREHWRKSDMRLPMLLQAYRTKESTDPRDKIYGLLGLVRGWGRGEPIEPVYNIDPRQLFEHVARRWIDIEQDLGFLDFRAVRYQGKVREEGITAKAQHDAHFTAISLGLLGYNPDKVQQMMNTGGCTLRWTKDRSADCVQFTQSSWAPDWTRLDNPVTARVIADRRARNILFDACKGRPTPCLHSVQPLFTASPVLTEAAVIPVAAYRVGAYLTDSPSESYHVSQKAATIPTSVMLYHEKESLKFEDLPVARGNISVHAVCRALIADSTIEPRGAASLQSADTTFRRASQADFKSVMLWNKWMQKNISNHRDVHVPPRRADFVDEETFCRIRDTDLAVRSVALRRRFFRLDSGHVGMAPEFTKPKDVVMVLLGAKCPYVLRELGPVPIKGLEDTNVHTVWTIIGECYINGIMDGEIVDLKEKEGKGPETIYVI